ncbi:MAG: response regulator [Clostridia bacterium]|nr:response regulator [Clostridia bacterium]
MEKSNKVMIIDDEKTFIVPLEIGLKRAGIDVVSFTDSIEAIEYLKNNRVNVLLTDYHMEPGINGDEVIKRVREFNKDIIIYLQTGYAEELPANEMLDKYEIQGFIDKGEGQEKNMQLIKSSLKQANLIEMVKEQKKEIDAQNYRNEFLGKFLNRLMGEIGERGMAMAGSIVHLEDMTENIQNNDKELFVNSVDTLKRNISKLNELIKSLSIDEGLITIGGLEHKLKNLFDITLSIKNVKLNIKYDDEYLMLNCQREILIYILVDIIESLINSNIKEINILAEKNEKVRIKICNNINDSNLMEKLNKLAYLDENIKIENEYEQIVIYIG